MMDLFYEQLVKKQRTWVDFVKIALCIVAAIVLVYVLVIGLAIPYIGFFVFIVCCALIYLLWLLITATNLEYEYTFTNGDLDVDKIINVRKRKRMTSLNARAIELMSWKGASQHEFERYLNAQDIKKVYACENRQADEVYYVIYMDDSDKKMLLFNPNEKIRQGFKRYNPQKVTLND